MRGALSLVFRLGVFVVASAFGSPTATAAPTATVQSRAIRSIRQALTDQAIRASFARPIAQLARIAWMTGTWNARVIRHIGPHRERSDASTYVFAPTMHGRWLFGADRRASDYVYITYDPLGNHWTLVRLEANPSYGTFVSSDDWRADRITFTSVAAFADGRPHGRTTTILKRNAHSFVIYDKERLADGTSLLDDIVTLEKQ